MLYQVKIDPLLSRDKFMLIFDKSPAALTLPAGQLNLLQGQLVKHLPLCNTLSVCYYTLEAKVKFRVTFCRTVLHQHSSSPKPQDVMMLRKFIPPKKHSTFRRRLLAPRHRNTVNHIVGQEESLTQKHESREESVLAFLGITCTILNLLVIIFVYIYTSL